MKKISLFITLILVLPAPAFAATFTVRPNGGGDYTTIQACANAAQAGDTCLVSGGTYNEEVTPTRDGLVGKWITFQAEDGQTPLVTGSWNLEGRHYIVIDGFEVGGGFSSSPYSGAVCGNIKILNNYINGAGVGINIKGNDVLISGNTFDNMSDDMIRQFMDRWTIRNNTVIGEIDSGDKHMDFWQSFCSGGDTGYTASYSLIENNEFIEVSGDNVHFSLVNGTASCNDPVTNLIIRYNKIRHVGSLGSYVDLNDSASGNTDNTIYNNTYVDLREGSLASWMDYAHIYDASTSSSGLNNIFYNAVDSSGAIGFLFGSEGYQAYNLYYDSSNIMTFRGAASGETGAIKNQNPLLTDPNNNDFSLKTGSPAVDKGGPLTHVAAADTGSGTSLIVDAAEFFQPGWGGADADWIAVGSVSNVAHISSIDYNSNTITLATPITRADGDPVYLYKDSDGTQVLRGSAPDIGAVESGFLEAPSNARIES